MAILNATPANQPTADDRPAPAWAGGRFYVAPRPPLVPLAYAAAWGQIQTGDLLLTRRRGLIATAGRSPYSHAAMAAWWKDRLFALEMRAAGGRALLLSHIVRRHDRRVDWYEANAGDRFDFDRDRALAAMQSYAGARYGWLAIARAALLHLPIVRLFVKASTDDRGVPGLGGPAFCSQAVAAATRDAGVDPVPNLADRLTEPADLARSPFYEFRGTLTEAPAAWRP